MKQCEIRAGVARGKFDSPTGYLIVYVPKMASGPHMLRARELVRQRSSKTVEITSEYVLDPSNPWDQIREALRNQLPSASYENWFRDTALAANDGDCLLVTVPDAETLTWVEREYRELITQTLRTLQLPFTRVAFQTGRGASADAGGLSI